MKVESSKDLIFLTKNQKYKDIWLAIIYGIYIRKRKRGKSLHSGRFNQNVDKNKKKPLHSVVVHLSTVRIQKVQRKNIGQYNTDKRQGNILCFCLKNMKDINCYINWSSLL